MRFQPYFPRSAVITTVGLLVLVLSTGAAFANNSWGPYHWARPSNPFTLKVGDNVSSVWDQYLDLAIADWSQSNVVDLVKVAGRTKPKTCRPTAGRVEACSAWYGNTGWLGQAQIWVTGGAHITQGVVKVNDYYFASSFYNTAGWRSLVMCQEKGHTLGLGHQDENFNNPPITPHTCMDYHIPGTSEIEHPNLHDYDQLALIYGHLDSTTTIGAAAPLRGQSAGGDEHPEWGTPVKHDAHGRPSLYVKDLGHDQRVVTYIIWAD